MPFESGRLGRALLSWLVIVLAGCALPAWAAEKTRLQVDDYQIEAELTPHIHRISARAVVKFTALEDIDAASFELNNDLRVTKVVDASGKPLSPERIEQESTIRVQLPTQLAKGQSTTLTFVYDGSLQNADNSPVQGLKLASIGDDTSYLLYAARWFPVNAYGINRFTATMKITVPAHMVVIGSGNETVSETSGGKSNEGLPTKTFTFVWDKPSFPGTIVAGTFQEFKTNEAGVDLHLFFKPIHQNLGTMYAETAVKEFTYFVTVFGPTLSSTLRVVEIPDDTVPAAC